MGYYDLEGRYHSGVTPKGKDIFKDKRGAIEMAIYRTKKPWRKKKRK